VAGLAESSRLAETSPLIGIAGLALLPWFFLTAIRPIAVLPSRSGSKRPIAPGPIALLSKPFAARPICPLVSEFPALKARRGVWLVPFSTAAIVTIEARTAIFAMAGARLVKCRIRFPGAGFFAAGLGKAPLFEFLLSARAVAGAAFAATWTVRPSAGIIVFVVIAGHERAHFGYRTNGKWIWLVARSLNESRRILSQNGIHFC
jgi:hypothetical protein